MCGFLAEYNRTHTLQSKSLFTSILAMSNHRGPDDQQYWSNQKDIQLGFNRLSILDVSDAGQQPMRSPQGRYILVFNGEIYNHLELRKQLSETPYKGHSDSETIVVCLEAWGIKKTVEALNGMFAMIIYDTDTQAISLVRDFAGIKPLFYGWDGGTLIAASQYDQVIAHPRFSHKSIDTAVLKLYLEQHVMPAPFGLYEDTYQVLPGEIVSISKEGRKTHHRYWELPKTVSPSIFNIEEGMTYISDVLDDSVARQLRSDVPLGAFLSGGVDSSLVCSSIKKQQQNGQVFTIGSDSQVHDETERAKQFAQALECQQHIWHLSSAEMLRYWDSAMKSLHEPLADFSILPTYMVSKLAKKHVTVALSGDGGDELFFGYERFWSIGKNIQYQHYPKIIRQALYGFDKYTTGNKRLNAVLLAPSQNVAHQGLHSRFRTTLLQAVAPELSTVALPEQYTVYNYTNTKDTRTLLTNMRHAEFYGMMQKTLRKVDLASMQNSLEVRVPFLDKQLIEASLQLDPMLSYGAHKRKHLLKQMMRQRFPSIPKEKTKKGFSVPLGKWLREDLNPIITERLLDNDVATFGFSRSAIEDMINIHYNKQADYKWPIFTLYALMTWRK
ncbi:asparagine synthase (glutamine-hydrolyzing) [Mangrovimonas spongiae]|uniref:asparagine synthase (glutamine-hydrolyzing) n=1 Tax=Mangrovimonas spongiae TaxID=2494697 RepID=A0A428K267_9FLAO|nr:asparagine synthase (glutamine-hydrolyzing) [Mangrovimonas spongiae]RSK40497.1 asparagine synthase (glutamine-hydrolyzing) [Mangrovimonas spongiae]